MKVALVLTNSCVGKPKKKSFTSGVMAAVMAQSEGLNKAGSKTLLHSTFFGWSIIRECLAIILEYRILLQLDLDTFYFAGFSSSFTFGQDSRTTFSQRNQC